MLSFRLRSIPEGVLYLLIGAAAVMLYLNSLPSGFVSDDRKLILQNDRIHSLRNIPGFFKEAFYEARHAAMPARYYRPVVSASFALDYAIGGPQRPWVFHLTNVVAYGVCAALVYALLRALMAERTAALLSSLLFIALCVHTETVSWISGRTDLFAMLFVLGAMLCLIRARNSGLQLQEPPSWRAALYYAGAFILVLLALFSKEVAVVLIPIWIAFELFHSKRIMRAGLWHRIGGVAVLVCATAIYLLARRAAVGSVGTGGTLRHFEPFSLSGLATIAACMWQYIAKLALPLNLSFGFEVEPFTSVASVPAVLSLVGAAALLAATVYAFIRRPAAGFALLWIWLALIPVLNFVPITETAAERFLFVPSFGFCLLIGLSLQQVGAAARGSELWARGAAAVVLALIVAHASLSLARNPDWRDQRTLYLATAESSPASPVARALAGEAYLESPASPERALLCYRQTLEGSEGKPLLQLLTHSGLGKLYIDLGNFDLALWHLRTAVEIGRFQPEPRNSLALALMQIGLERGLPRGIDLGKKMAEEMIRDDPQHASAYSLLGAYYMQVEKDSPRAAEMFGKAAELDSSFAEAAYLKGAALKDLGRYEAAEAAYEEALRRNPGYYAAHLELAEVCLKQGKLQKALKAANRALTINPDGQADALLKQIQQRIPPPAPSESSRVGRPN